MPRNDLLAALDRTRPQTCCSGLPPSCYFPAYVGPHYGEKAKILFVGLDSGRSDANSEILTAKRWQEGVYADEYRSRKDNKANTAWNPHYRGCVRTAGAILQMACEKECANACGVKPPSECVLSFFAQSNVVKCAPPKNGMNFLAASRVDTCIPNLFAEIEILQPDVIVLQGRNRTSGSIHKDFQGEIVAGKWGVLSIEPENIVGTISWTRGQIAGMRSVIACFAHPSARGQFNLKNLWAREILPSVPTIRELLAARDS